jgi:hypothetical protein
MKVTGNINKMETSVNEVNFAQYMLPVGENQVDMNELIGFPITLTFEDQINCIACDEVTPKSYRQGYCKSCSTSLQEASDCRIKPELCDHTTGSCTKPHYVYLSYTGSVKVGITQHIDDEVSTRWIDQGAGAALPIIKTRNRLLSGLVECAFKAFVADRTNWRLMLSDYDLATGECHLLNALAELRKQVQPDIDRINEEYGTDAATWLDDAEVVRIAFPVNQYPVKIKSHNLDKEPVLTGTLQGIKGQYLIFDNIVINVRKYSGYKITLTTE